MEIIYLYALIIAGSLALLYLLFSDVFDSIISIGDIAPGSILNPVVILAFIAIFGGTGYVLELQESLNSILIFIIASVVSLIIVSIVQFFILVPLSKAEQSTVQSINELIGKEGEVITTIPANGVGEVLILSKLGSTGNIARCIYNLEILEGTTVLVKDITHEGVLVVSPKVK